MDDQSARIVKIEKHPFTPSLGPVACEGVKACFVIRSGICFPMRCHSVGCDGEPNAIANAVGYAQQRSRSHDAVIRVYDDAVNLIETHEHKDEFKEW